MREKHIGQDLGQTLIFTYKHWHDFLTENKRQRSVGAIVSQHITLIGVTVSVLSTLREGAKKKKTGTRSTTMNFNSDQQEEEKKHNQREKVELEKFT